MKQQYYTYLANFINETKRERILYELQSEKKRETAFSKMTEFAKCFNEKDIVVNLSHLQDDLAVQTIEKTIAQKECFDLAYGKMERIKDAYQRAVNSYCLDVLIVDERTVIYVGECEYGASEKYILQK